MVYAKKTAQKQVDGVLQRPHIPTAPEFYCQIMRAIEPDLLLSTVEREQKYAGQISEQKKKRMERYAAAFCAYQQQRIQAYDNLRNEVTTYMHDIRTLAEATSDQEDERVLHDIEIQLSVLDLS